MANAIRGRAVLIAAAAVVVAGCGGDSPGDPGSEGGDAGGTQQQQQQQAQGQQPETITLNGETANLRGRVDVSGRDSVDMDLGNFYFEPTVLTGDPGQRVTVQLSNVSSTSHTFTIRGQGVDEVVSADGSATAEVTMPESGTTVFVCRFHAGQGMRGGLRVAGDGAQQGGDGSGGGQGESDQEGSGGPGY